MAGSGGRRSKRGGAKLKGKGKTSGRKVSAKKGKSRR
jgi:hypothetical protein